MLFWSSERDPVSNQPRRILLVAPTQSLMKQVVATLVDRGYEVDVVSTFTAAKARLAQAPLLLVTELKLGDFNGLHLAVRALAAGVPALVLGEPDPVLQRDAQQLGAVYLSVPAAGGEEIGIAVQELLAADGSADRQPDGDCEVVTEPRGPAVTYLFPSRIAFSSPPVAASARRRDSGCARILH